LAQSDEAPENGGSFDSDDGKIFIYCVRWTLDLYLRHSKVQVCRELETDARYNRKLGCFVTIRQANTEKSLRGCIGFSEPVYPLPRALTLAAISAAVEDPRFPVMRENELERVTFEVSILTPPRIISVSNPREYPGKITIGKTGLILKWRFGSGLLLPQVPVEEKWTEEDFLANLSQKAGALPDQWLLPETEIFGFGAQVFEELVPHGPVMVKI
jgi:uncharacterized protein